MIATKRAGRLEIAELASVPTETLWSELNHCADLQADHLRYLAAVYAELLRRGEDLSTFRGGYYAYLTRIANGNLLPEVIDRFLGTAACPKVAGLPLDRQKELVQTGATVPVAEYRDGAFTHRSLPLAELVPSQVEQVFAKKKKKPGEPDTDWYVRSVAEQTRFLQSPAVLPSSYTKPKKIDRIKIDKDKGIVTFAVKSVTLVELCDALRAAGIKKL